MNADIWARVDEAIDTDPLQLRDIVAEVLARAETAEAAVERLRARHQPKTITQITPCPKHQPYRPGVKDCPDCRTERVQVCSNITCCTWPCKDRIALDTTGGAESPADPLHAAIECVLIDHRDQLDGDNVDPNLAELAYVYRQQTGWTVADEVALAATESPADVQEGSE